MESNTDKAFEQYKLYVQKTDRFTDRSFNTNRYFVAIIIALFVITCIFNNTTFRFFTAPMIFSILGMGMSFCWWSNVDTYGFFNRIKIKDVIDKIEEDLPYQCHLMEKKALDEIRSKKKAFFFSDVQKIIASLSFIIFMIIFITDFMHLYIKI